MSDSNNKSWLSDYYGRIQGECKLSFERRDRTTHWSYIVLTAVVTAYIGFFADGNFVTPLGRFGLVSGVLLVLIRFFFQSMIAYGYFLKWRYFRTKIEEHWMNGTPSIDEIKQDIVNFDHNKAMPETGRNLFMGQVKSGFILILAIPITLLAIELHLTQTWEYFMILISVGSYFVLESYNFKKYDQVRSAGHR